MTHKEANLEEQQRVYYRLCAVARSSSSIRAVDMADRLIAAGVTIRDATWEDRHVIMDMLIKDFFPDEPVTRSMMAYGEKSKKNEEKFFRKHVVYPCLKSKGTNLVAISRDNRIIACKLGHNVKRKNSKNSLPNLSWLRHFSWFLSDDDIRGLAVYDALRKLKYDPHMQMKVLGSQQVFMGEVLCVSSECRGLKLGTELVQRSIERAQSLNCSHYVALVSGLYSQKIYHNFGFGVQGSVQYADLRDMKGRIVVHDRREHTHMELVVKAI